jgi:alpha-mannosidase
LISDNTIQVTTVKKTESGNDIIIRLFEPTGKKRNALLSMPVISKKIKITMMPFEIRTLRVNLQTKKVTQVNLIERPIQRKKESDI